MSLADKSDEQALWRAVIMQALTDATSNPTNALPRRDIDAARKWLTQPNSDFEYVCELAGMDPYRVRRKALEAIAKGEAHTKPKLHSFNGMSMTLAGWAKQMKISRSALAMRLASGWSLEQALMTPVRKRADRGIGSDFEQGSRDRRGRHAQDCTKIENFS